MESPIFKYLSALLCYPEAELIEALPELRSALAAENIEAHYLAPINALMNYLGEHSLREVQENYVATFDRNRRQALYLFEHIHGEERERGAALVDLLEEYRKHGFELGDAELPDYLPALLEFLAIVDKDTAATMLGGAVHVIEHIAQALRETDSPYAALFNYLVALSPEKPLPLTVPPVRDMDEAMETFGADQAGVEPLLQNNWRFTDVNSIKFYPQDYHKQTRRTAK